MLNSLHAFTAHRFSEPQGTNYRTEANTLCIQAFIRYFFQTLRLPQIAFSKKIHRSILWSSSYIIPRTMHAANPLIRVIFNASQKRNQSFSRKNDRSRASLYLGVPVSLLQHKCIRDFKWLWIVKPSVCHVSER